MVLTLLACLLLHMKNMTWEFVARPESRIAAWDGQKKGITASILLHCLVLYEHFGNLLGSPPDTHPRVSLGTTKGSRGNSTLYNVQPSVPSQPGTEATCHHASPSLHPHP
ncbi:hypothetical protein ACRALDRAFT_212611 [Sodiomyces alcalophilus JCM 7366]|uniref:uncharacterized protein n=1 Tax=Sodiomyces alcalophilus JCM 7366 TaxID=591952 RepID=UPI0039B3F6C1